MPVLPSYFIRFLALGDDACVCVEDQRADDADGGWNLSEFIVEGIFLRFHIWKSVI